MPKWTDSLESAVPSVVSDAANRIVNSAKQFQTSQQRTSGGGSDPFQPSANNGFAEHQASKSQNSSFNDEGFTPVSQQDQQYNEQGFTPVSRQEQSSSGSFSQTGFREEAGSGFVQTGFSQSGFSERNSNSDEGSSFSQSGFRDNSSDDESGFSQTGFREERNNNDISSGFSQGGFQSTGFQ